ncbi:glycosyltransferase family 2 protein [Nocardioides sp. Bht2]|uniref:glycosyltransferase family 2 protein n=1 Tax=Nocardioides sp. Bht2 TaxID=3392297 RepID=UPI0039B6D000
MLPDVSVIVPVYNTRRYLAECLDSVLGQTIGRTNVQIVAVDDGSTDGSGELLDEYASRFPDQVVVLHQANSGGPAAPCNVGLEHATGRYVFFLGSDDYLGIEALERMVSKADEWGTDVMCVRLIGTQGRVIPQELFAENQPEIGFPDQRPFLTANTKLFRRELLEKHGIRYQENIAIASDQTFTIEAMYRAGRISVLGDYDYYYAVLRSEGGNLMFDPSWERRLDSIDLTMDYVAELIDDPGLRDEVLYRHFRWEYSGRLKNLLEHDEVEQQRLLARVAYATDRHFTDRIAAMMTVPGRLRLELARKGDLESLVELCRVADSDERPVRVVLPEGLHLRYPGFGKAPRSWYAETMNVRGVIRRISPEVTDVMQTRSAVVVEARAPIDPVSAPYLRVVLAPIVAGEKVAQGKPVTDDVPGTIVGAVDFTADGRMTASFASLDLRRAAHERFSLRLQVTAAGERFDSAFNAPARSNLGDLAVGRGTEIRLRTGPLGRVVLSRVAAERSSRLGFLSRR